MRVVLVVLVVMLSGCLVEGTQCTPTGGAVCQDAKTALWCEGIFTKYECPGNSGCTSNNNGIVCDFRGSREGTRCPAVAKGAGYCSSGTRFVSCTQPPSTVEFLWAGRDCSACNQNGLNATCQP